MGGEFTPMMLHDQKIANGVKSIDNEYASIIVFSTTAESLKDTIPYEMEVS